MFLTYPRYDDPCHGYPDFGTFQQFVPKIDSVPKRYKVSFDLKIVSTMQPSKEHFIITFH